MREWELSRRYVGKDDHRLDSSVIRMTTYISGIKLPRGLTPGSKVYTSKRPDSIEGTLSWLINKIFLIPPNQQGLRVVAIGGPTGSGKSTLTNLLAERIDESLVIEMDRWRGPLGKENLTTEEYLEVLGLEQFKIDMKSLLYKGIIERPPGHVEYRTLTQPKEWEEKPLCLGAKKIIFFIGIAALHDSLKDLSQLKIDIGTDPQLRRLHKERRKRPLAANRLFARDLHKNADIHLELVFQNGSYSYIAYE